MNDLKDFQIIDGVLVKYNGENTKVVVPEGVTSINDGAFKFCENITEIVLPDSVSCIGEEVFWGCSWLNSISLPDSLVCVCNSAFSCCNRLTEITCYYTTNPAKNYKSIDGVLYTADGKTLVFYPQGKLGGRFVVPDGVEHIGDFSMLSNTHLTKVVLPSGVKSIGEGAFSACVELGSVVLPESIEYIHPDAFNNCPKILGFDISDCNNYYKVLDDSLYTKDGKQLICYAAGYGDSEFIIPQGVTSINKLAFCDCKLVNVVIPDTVKSIGDKAFIDCKMLLTLTIPESVTEIGESVFDYCEYVTIRTPKGSFAEKYANNNNIKVEYIDS